VRDRAADPRERDHDPRDPFVDGHSLTSQLVRETPRTSLALIPSRFSGV
jgi:hypothetical protein